MASDSEDGTVDEGSVVSKSTNLVTDVADFARGLKGVVSRPSYLTNLTGRSFIEAVDVLYTSANGIVAELAAQVDGLVVKFTIGKAYVKKHRRHAHLLSGAMKTWSLEGVLSRWKSYYRPHHYAGIIVLACSTNKVCQGTRYNNLLLIRTDLGFAPGSQEDYALSLEQALTHRYRWTDKNRALLNETAASGGTKEQGHAGYAVYIALKLVAAESNR